ncbi:hypothetical protein TCAL_04693 [Tigriopus californicus]|uniref:Uncharacterized protein n=2 Tax=Tigriopus californicus TaxID=6832 RepID=A0A553NTJ5_TIGCA|nr:hypothetical protein TCAL_04693 [Tigriopus californicus]|eukprot:TCALIF_04693-PA protein Name:"Protein of unknown function" AED:0.32 eAED:0.32 QI:91/1/1/1/0.5/0.66/3/81/204
MKSVFLFAITFYLLYFIQAQKTCVKINECEVEASLIEYHGQDALLQDQLKDRLAKLNCSPANATELHVYCANPNEEIIRPEEDTEDEDEEDDESDSSLDYGIRHSGGILDALNFNTRQSCLGSLKLYYFNPVQDSVRILNLRHGTHSRIPVPDLGSGFFFQAKTSGSCCWQLCSKKFFRGSRRTLNPGVKLKDVSVESAKTLNC